MLWPCAHRLPGPLPGSQCLAWAGGLTELDPTHAKGSALPVQYFLAMSESLHEVTGQTDREAG